MEGARSDFPGMESGEKSKEPTESLTEADGSRQTREDMQTNADIVSATQSSECMY